MHADQEAKTPLHWCAIGGFEEGAAALVQASGGTVLPSTAGATLNGMHAAGGRFAR